MGPAPTQPLPGDGPLLPEPLPLDPFPPFRSWFDQAAHDRVQPNPNCFTLATVDPDGRPSARIVLCKAIDPGRGAISFFTNYTSRKSEALDAHPRAAAVFHWDSLDRQVRLEGPTARLPRADSEAYFASRPWQSRIGAWASDQSRPVESREALLERVHAAMRRFGIDPADPPKPDADVHIPCPAYWGGWMLLAERVELWISGTGRIHDRAAWTRPVRSVPNADGVPITGPWSATRLQP